MSQENVEILRRLNFAFNQGDFDTVVELFHPDAELTDLLNAPDVPQSVHGRSAIREVIMAWANTFEEFSGDVSEFIDAGDVVLCVTHYRGVGKGSGLRIDYHGVDVHELDSGKVVRSTLGYPSRTDALEAVGLSE